MDSRLIYPREGDKETVYLKNVITRENIKTLYNFIFYR